VWGRWRPFARQDASHASEPTIQGCCRLGERGLVRRSANVIGISPSLGGRPTAAAEANQGLAVSSAAYTLPNMTACPNCGFQNTQGVKFCAECGQKLASVSPVPRETRRTVTVLFADVTGSTALGEQLDPESLRALMGRYFAAMKEIVERHGGTVEKFIGDAVMAVFGIPTLHEDDAVRAVRAAQEVRETLAGLNDELQQTRGLAVVFRTGVNTGTVVAGDSSVGQTLITGDTVNTAARLEQAAQPGEILLGEATYRLVRDAVVAQPIEPIEAKGKAQPLPAYRLVSVTPGAAGRSRRLDTPMVGRNREIHVLADAFDRAVADRAGQLVTVLGAAGVGKSRLVQEFRQRVDGRATFLMGRCLSYGEGLTYWPLADALRAAVVIDEERPVESWGTGLMGLMAGQPQAEAVVERVVGLIGAGEAGAGSDAFWAVRRLLEGMARQLPLVLVIDDLHWATPTFLDLVEHVADWTRDAPILLVCLARPDLLDKRPGWGGGKMNATTFLLEPLDATSIDVLLAHLVGTEVAMGLGRRIAAAAEGNPLFVEELVAMLVERGGLAPHGDGMRLVAEPAELEVPPTIEALMAARLDQLPGDERAVLERGSVIGAQFGAGEVARLSNEPGLAMVRSALMAMVRRDLVRPDPDARLPMGADDEAFRFRHQLIREGAYAAMSKAERARLHERYAALLEELPAERLPQLDEVIGYHLEQAYLLWASLGGKPGQPDTASRAASRLGAAGLRANERWDSAAAANLLARATILLPLGDPDRISYLPQLAHALIALGRFDEAQAAVDEAIGATDTSSDRAARVQALLARAELADRKGAGEVERRPDLEEALAIATASGDLTQLARVQGNLAWLIAEAGQLGEARRLLELAIDAAERSGDVRFEVAPRRTVGTVMLWGTWAAADIERILAENLAFAREHGLRFSEGHALRAQAVETARRGRVPEARRLMAESVAIFEDVGGALYSAGTLREQSFIESLAGDLPASERLLREAYDQLSAMGERGIMSTVAADLADALVDLGRIDEAEALCAVAEDAGPEDDILTQVGVRLVRGRLAALRGRTDEALASVADAMALADQGEYYDSRAVSRLVFAQLLVDAGRTDEARARAQEVLDLARPRGDVVYAGRATGLLERAEMSKPGPG
jgi:class 3 adenylate cyclase/tetratricopeptide (TPR) repeat protein